MFRFAKETRAFIHGCMSTETTTPTIYHPPTPTPYHPPNPTLYHPSTSTLYHSTNPTLYQPPTPTLYHPPTPTLYHPPTLTLYRVWVGRGIYKLVQSKYLSQTKLQALSPLETVVSVDNKIILCYTTHADVIHVVISFSH